MTAAIGVVRTGPFCTLQDAGRTGYLRFGVTPAGPMDWIAHSIANIMAGNDRGSGAIEVGPGGIEIEAVGGPIRVGVSAEGFNVYWNSQALAARFAVTLASGDRLQIAPGKSRMWAYLAVSGGFSAPPVMGSLSTHARSGVGPFGGKMLSKDQTLPLGERLVELQTPPLMWPEPLEVRSGVLRYVAGPQADALTRDALETLHGETYYISQHSDRMGYRLEGPKLQHANGYDIVSDGVPLGAVQVPGDGLPIILMADRQPTGGYPKPGVVIRSDLPRLAQMRPNEPLRLRSVSLDEAVFSLKSIKTILDKIEVYISRHYNGAFGS